MIKYVVLEDKKQVIAIMDGDTTWDAINKIYKMCHNSPISFCAEKYMMPKTFKATVTCHKDDKFDAEVGKKMAKEKLLKNYYRSFDKRIDKFREDLTNLNGKIFEISDVNA